MRGSTLFKCVQGAVQVAMVWRAAAVPLVLSEEGGKCGGSRREEGWEEPISEIALS